MFIGIHRCRHCIRPHVFTICSRGAFAIHDTILILYVHYIHLHGHRLFFCYNTHPLCNLVIVNSNIIMYYYYNERPSFQTSRVRYSCTAAPPQITTHVRLAHDTIIRRMVVITLLMHRVLYTSALLLLWSE